MSRARFWVFTLNNPDPNNPLDDLPAQFALNDQVHYAIWQRELSKTGTPHFQGYLEFKSTQRLAACKKLHQGAHWEVRRGTQADAIRYNSKEDTRIDGPFEYGTAPTPGQGTRNDLEKFKEDIDSGMSPADLWDANFGTMLRHNKAVLTYKRAKQVNRTWKTNVIVLTGPPGCGKTRWCHEKFPGAFWKSNSSQWWDDYNSEECVVIDDFYGWITYSTMLRIMDRYPLQLEVKGGHIKFLARTLCITSNKRPEQWYSDEVLRRHDLGALLRRIDRRITWNSDGDCEDDGSDGVGADGDANDECRGFDLNE